MSLIPNNNMCSIQSRELKQHGQSILPTAVFENIPHRTTKIRGLSREIIKMSDISGTVR